MSWREIATAVALAALVAASARAEDMVVVSARGIGLAIGQKIDAAKPLVLAEGQHVTLIAEDGVTVKLDGPYDKPPTAARGGGVLTAAVGAFLTQAGPRTGEVGVTRAGGTVADLPDPWLLDISQDGTVCLRAGQPAVLWRADDTKHAILTVMPADRSWEAEASWAAGADRLALSHNIAVHPDSVFFMRLDHGEEHAVTVSYVPNDLDNDKMRVAWLADEGCEAQAEALQRRLR